MDEKFSASQPWATAYSRAVGNVRERDLDCGRVASHPRQASQMARGMALCLFIPSLMQALVADPSHKSWSCIGVRNLGIACSRAKCPLEANRSDFHRVNKNLPKPFLSYFRLLSHASQSMGNDEENNQNTFDNLLDIFVYQEYENAKNHRPRRMGQLPRRGFPCKGSSIFRTQSPLALYSQETIQSLPRHP
ncbi:hypothetical protein [Extensimonas sp. H3M7-6]|uniref:hypothetical protein n=1 Tax=Extensimonas soli TaxID=3031322 RepID=UPI0023DC5776|nr:hypothetical protein [Extensimonas sp. H3M7-6]